MKHQKGRVEEGLAEVAWQRGPCVGGFQLPAHLWALTWSVDTGWVAWEPMKLMSPGKPLGSCPLPHDHLGRCFLNTGLWVLGVWAPSVL